MENKNISVIVVPHDNSKTWNFRFSYRLLYTFSALAALLVVLVIVFVFTYGRILAKAQTAVFLERENKQLVHQTAQIDSLRLELLNLQAMGIQIKRMLGVKMTPDDSLLVARLSPSVKSPAIVPADEGEGVDVREQKRMLDAFPSIWPVKGYLTRDFRNTGGEKSPEFHPGIDIAADRNTPVQAAADGVIVTSGFDETYGWMVEIDHGFGIESVYGHNTRNLVQVGDRIARGKTIAFVGSTGKSTAPHLHFEVRKNGVPVDPKKYLLN